MSRLWIIMLAILCCAQAARAEEWQSVPGQVVSDAAEAYVRSTLGGAAVHSVRSIPARRVPAGQLQMVARWLGEKPQGEIQGRRFIVPVALVVDGRPRETVGVMVEIGVPPSGARHDNPRAETVPGDRPRTRPTAAKMDAASIRRGDHVTLTCHNAARTLQIEVDGVARETGSVGESIRVQLEHRTVEARVTGPQQAEVDL